MPSSLPTARWRPLPWLLCNLAALLWFAGWLWAPSRALWDAVDTGVFRLLNGTLGTNAGWDFLWAFASTRVADILIGALMLVLLIRGDWVFPRPQVRQALFTFLGVLVLMLIIREGMSDLGDVGGWQHASPSDRFDDGLRLSERFPGLEQVFEVKDRSSKSFPGDHASVLLTWGLFMALFATGWKRLLVIGLPLFFCVPRLIAGAHWFSDDFASGLAITLLALGWGLCTPAAGHIAGALEWMSRPAVTLATQVPIVRRWAVFARH